MFWASKKEQEQIFDWVSKLAVSVDNLRQYCEELEDRLYALEPKKPAAKKKKGTK